MAKWPGYLTRYSSDFGQIEREGDIRIPPTQKMLPVEQSAIDSFMILLVEGVKKTPFVSLKKLSLLPKEMSFIR